MMNKGLAYKVVTSAVWEGAKKTKESKPSYDLLCCMVGCLASYIVFQAKNKDYMKFESRIPLAEMALSLASGTEWQPKEIQRKDEGK